MIRYAFGDVVSPGAWDPVYVQDHSHLARLLVPDGEAFFGQLAAPPPGVHNTSNYLVRVFFFCVASRSIAPQWGFIRFRRK